MDGPPPRRRGAHRGPLLVREGDRTTPASAGSTTKASSPTLGRSDHPRVGGEHPQRGAQHVAAGGPPPRRRGAHGRAGSEGQRTRTTPASAGSTAHPRGWRTAPPDHPRVGGEHGRDPSGSRSRRGPPPRRRGARTVLLRGTAPERTTPASAGSTDRAPARYGAGTDHPCVGGEHWASATCCSAAAGPPPRRRGAPDRRLRGRFTDRTTPASAGSTRKAIPSRCRRTDHPRVGGEHLLDLAARQEQDGPPPRRRGARAVRPVEQGDARTTPASAGSTRSSCCTITPTPDHPRVGGEHLLALLFVAYLLGPPPRGPVLRIVFRLV